MMTRPAGSRDRPFRVMSLRYGRCKMGLRSAREAVPGLERPGHPGCGRTGERARGRCRAGWGSEGEVGRMAVRKIAHSSVEDRKAKGLEARDRAELSSHTKWRAA